MVHRVAERLDHADVSAELIRQAYADALEDQPQLGDAFRADIVAVFDRDPATDRFIEPVLYYKGFHAIQTHRLAHWLWSKGRKDFAYYLQSRSSAVFQCDIHPAAKIGRGIFLDHATGLVVGETAVIDDDVSMLHGVTLGGTGKEHGDRHPKIGRRRADRRGRQHHRQHRGRPLRPRRGGLGGAQGGAEQRHRRRRAGEGRRRRRLARSRRAPWTTCSLDNRRRCLLSRALASERRKAERVRWTLLEVKKLDAYLQQAVRQPEHSRGAEEGRHRRGFHRRGRSRRIDRRRRGRRPVLQFPHGHPGQQRSELSADPGADAPICAASSTTTISAS